MNQVDARGAASPGWYTSEGRTRWWDGTTWSDSPPAPDHGPFRSVRTISTDHGPFRSVRTIGAVLQLCLVAGCLTSLAGIQALVERLDILDRLDPYDGKLTLAEIDRADRFLLGAQAAQIALMVVTALVLFAWLWRVYQNLHGILGARNLDVSPGWAVGWWLVPFANLVKPLGVMSDAWAASRPGYQPHSDLWKHGGRTPLLPLWWAAFIGTSILVRIAGAASGTDASSDAGELEVISLRLETWIAIGGRALFVVAGVLLVLIVRQIGDRQHARHADLYPAG